MNEQYKLKEKFFNNGYSITKAASVVGLYHACKNDTYCVIPWYVLHPRNKLQIATCIEPFKQTLSTFNTFIKMVSDFPQFREVGTRSSWRFRSTTMTN